METSGILFWYSRELYDDVWCNRCVFDLKWLFFYSITYLFCFFYLFALFLVYLNCKHIWIGINSEPDISLFSLLFVLSATPFPKEKNKSLTRIRWPAHLFMLIHLKWTKLNLIEIVHYRALRVIKNLKYPKISIS